MLAGSLFETKRTGDPANPWRNDNAPPTLLFPAMLAGEHARLTADGFLTLVTSPVGFGSVRRQAARPDILYRGPKTAKARRSSREAGELALGSLFTNPGSRAIVRAGAGSAIREPPLDESRHRQGEAGL